VFNPRPTAKVSINYEIHLDSSPVFEDEYFSKAKEVSSMPILPIIKGFSQINPSIQY
jgi:hypothetical protein